MKTVLITGASHGIGAQTARLFGKKGYAVAINYNKSETQAKALEKELKTLGVLAKTYKADVSDVGEITAMFEEIKKDFGTLDVLVNNAGVSSEKMLCDTSEEDYNFVMDTNLKGTVFCSKLAQEIMVKNKKGAIVNVSSMWGEIGASCESVYSASKAAVIGFTKALAKELGLSGITVNCIEPGVINTEMNAELDDETLAGLCDETPVGRIGQTYELAEFVFVIATEKSGFLTGQVIGFDGGFTI